VACTGRRAALAGSGRVALGGCPPRAPTDPYVVTLDHTVPRVTRSLCRDLTSAVANPYSAIRWYCGDTRREFSASHVVPSSGRATRCLASHPPGPRGPSSPASSVLSRHCDFLPSLPPRFVSFVWWYHGSTLFFAPAAAACVNGGPGVGYPVAPAGILPWRRQELPSSWGTSIAHLPMLFDSGGTARPRPFGADARPWVLTRPRLPQQATFEAQ
jgi:hypothetical protein